MSVTLQQSLFFRAAFQRFHVFAQARLIFADGFDFVLPRFYLRAQAIDFIFLVEHAAKSFLHGRRYLSLLGDECHLLFVEIGQSEFTALGMVFVDLKILCLAGWNGDAKAQVRSGCFLGPRTFD